MFWSIYFAGPLDTTTAKLQWRGAKWEKLGDEKDGNVYLSSVCLCEAL